jgi:NDP-sugar pyrophosphorylase family protein
MFKAAILAAGEGSRLRAEGLVTPKPLVTIAGVPMIERIARQLQSAGASEIVCIINEASTAVRTHLQSLALPIPIQIVVKSTPSSFHSFCELSAFLRGGPFVLSLTDSIFTTAELSGFIHFARQHPELDGVLGITKFVDDENPLRVRLGEENRVIAIGPEAQASPYVTGGIYWFSEKILRAAAQAKKLEIQRLRNFLAFLLQQHHPMAGYFFDIIIDVDTLHDIKLAETEETKRWNTTSSAFGEIPNSRRIM